MVYFFSDNLKCPERFEKYNPKVISFKDVVDDKKNIIIAPEAGTWVFRNYKKLRKSVWWLSYNNFDGLTGFSKALHSKIKNFIKFFLNLFLSKDNKYKYDGAYPDKLLKGVCHFCGSKYAYSKLIERRYENVEMLVEPLSLEYIKAGMSKDLTTQNRSDKIPYNPAKPSRIMEMLLKRDDLEFVPIKNMEISEIIELFRNTKLYIDFGEFPGPERLPKESVYNGTCLIVGKRNAAENDFDVAIPDKFKIVDYENEELVVENIKEVLANYDKYIDEFEYFRNKIDNLENNFINSICKVFVKISE
ncbi:MAG: hypothetical protein K2K38_06205 [Clostridia bacterium]|nr:hypothetical protein [Clostridia bacterium]